jgi:hypothetical protein
VIRKYEGGNEVENAKVATLLVVCAYGLLEELTRHEEKKIAGRMTDTAVAPPLATLIEDLS